MVYFKIREGDSTKIKIGYTADHRGGTKRRKELQTGSPELLVDYAEPLWGHTKQTEKYFHAFLKKWHIRGDWFRLDKEAGRIIRNIIDEIKRADLSMPLFAYAQRHDTQIFQLEEQLGAAQRDAQVWKANTHKVVRMFSEAINDRDRALTGEIILLQKLAEAYGHKDPVKSVQRFLEMAPKRSFYGRT